MDQERNPSIIISDLALHLDLKTNEQMLSPFSSPPTDYDIGHQLEPTPKNDSRFEGGECEVPLSLPIQEAMLIREVVRNVITQPVDLQTYSSAATEWTHPLLNYDKLYSASKPVDSPSARPSMLTLTRDVPELSDEPLAAVNMDPCHCQASIHLRIMFFRATYCFPVLRLSEIHRSLKEMRNAKLILIDGIKGNNLLVKPVTSIPVKLFK